MRLEDGGAFVLGLFALVAVVLVVVVWQLAGTYRARVALHRDQEYQRLVETTESHLRDNQARLEELTTRLTDVQDRMGRLEKILREVE